MQSSQLLWKFVFDEDTTFWCSEVCTSLAKLLAVEGLVNDTNAGPSINSHADHARDMIQVAFCEPLSAVKRIYPDDHLLLEELVRELIVVVVSLGRRHAVDLLHFLEVASVTVFVHVVVLHQHLLTDMILVEFVGHDVGALTCYRVFDLVFFADYDRTRVQLTQVVFDSVLNVHVHFSENVLLS